MTSVTKAISAVMGEIERLAKGDKNQHGNYNFASIDDFLDLTRPLCAKHGLSVFQDEESFEVFEVQSKSGPQKMLLMRFAFTIEAEGESKGPYRRSIMVPASMGSQAFGAAQSYALKQFLRATFQIATGDKDDIDHHNTGELSARPPKEEATKPREKLAGPHTSKTALWAAVKLFDREIRSCGDIDQFEALMADKDTKALTVQIQRDAPALWSGGDSLPPEFEPLERLIQLTRDELNIRAAA